MNGVGAKTRNAFTLIELLVVVAIIALLISILLPSLTAARNQAKQVTCLANMRSCSQASVVFATDRQGRFQLVSDEVGVAKADASRQRFAYGEGGELLSWPVALANAAGISYKNNWDWGVRARTYEEAKQLQGEIKRDNGMVTCPSDRVEIASPFYPRNKPNSFGGINNNGLRGSGNGVGSSGSDAAYWGYLSYGISEDVTGAETAESAGRPACWRSTYRDGQWYEARGEFSYPPAFPGARDGWRLQGELDKVYQPAAVGLIFEAGRDEDRADITGFANLVLSAQANGPYLGDFQQYHQARMPINRHPKGRINILYADGHGDSAIPAQFGTAGLPLKYAPRVRVSPYSPGSRD
ncbi:MAG: prepilin-type N-terminal cleavage/methylation domain-containing protein [Phycisphaerales bacterium]|nr:prepilin-type N-terminal cleavage/methylation domain-containing protein [Phycisphaerales bacterium]